MAKRRHIPKARAYYVEPASEAIASLEYDGAGTLTVEFLTGRTRIYDYAVSDDEARAAKAAARAGETGEWVNATLL